MAEYGTVRFGNDDIRQMKAKLYLLRMTGCLLAAAFGFALPGGSVQGGEPVIISDSGDDEILPRKKVDLENFRLRPRGFESKSSSVEGILSPWESPFRSRPAKRLSPQQRKRLLGALLLKSRLSSAQAEKLLSSQSERSGRPDREFEVKDLRYDQAEDQKPDDNRSERPEDEEETGLREEQDFTAELDFSSDLEYSETRDGTRESGGGETEEAAEEETDDLLGEFDSIKQFEVSYDSFMVQLDMFEFSDSGEALETPSTEDSKLLESLTRDLAESAEIFGLQVEPYEDVFSSLARERQQLLQSPLDQFGLKMNGLLATEDLIAGMSSSGLNADTSLPNFNAFPVTFPSSFGSEFPNSPTASGVPLPGTGALQNFGVPSPLPQESPMNRPAIFELPKRSF